MILCGFDKDFEDTSDETLLQKYERISKFKYPNDYTVEWFLNSIKHKKFQFDQKEQIIGVHFVDFENVCNCLVISTKEYAKIINLANGEVYQTQYPFPTRKALKYQYGLILERDVYVDEDADHQVNIPWNYKFCAFYDPFSEFGMIEFAEFPNDLQNSLSLLSFACNGSNAYEKYLATFISCDDSNKSEHERSTTKFTTNTLLYVVTVSISKFSKPLYLGNDSGENTELSVLANNFKKNFQQPSRQSNINYPVADTVKTKKQKPYGSLQNTEKPLPELRSVSQRDLSARGISDTRNFEISNANGNVDSHFLPGFDQMSSIINTRIISKNEHNNSSNNQTIYHNSSGKKIVSGSSTGLSAGLRNVDLISDKYSAHRSDNSIVENKNISNNKISDRIYSNVEQNEDMNNNLNFDYLTAASLSKSFGNLPNENGRDKKNNLKFVTETETNFLALPTSNQNTIGSENNMTRKRSTTGSTEKTLHEKIVITLQKIIELPWIFQKTGVSYAHCRNETWEHLWICSMHSEVLLKFSLNIRSLTSPREKFVSSKPEIIVSTPCCNLNSQIVQLENGFFKIENANANVADTPIRILNPLIELDQTISATNFSFQMHSKIVQKFFKCIKCLASPKLYCNYLFLWSYIRSLSPPSCSEFDCFASTMIFISLNEVLFFKNADKIDSSAFKCQDNKASFFPLYEKITANEEYMKSFIVSDIPKLLPSIVLSLSIMKEELELNVLEQTNCEKLNELLFLLTVIMQWPSAWLEHYRKKVVQLSHTNKCTYDFIVINVNASRSDRFPSPLLSPNSIIEHIESMSKPSAPTINNIQLPLSPSNKYLMLSDVFESSQKINFQLTPRTCKMIELFDIFNSTNQNINIVQVFRKLQISKHELETFPLGIYSLLNQLIKNYERLLVNVNSVIDVDLVSRVDLQKTSFSFFHSNNDLFHGSQNIDKPTLNDSDVMEHKQKNMPITYHDLLSQITNTYQTSSPPTASIGDLHSVGKFQTASKIFGHDKRFLAASRLVCFFLPVLALDYPKIGDEYVKKSSYLHAAILKQLANSVGWGALTYSTCAPLPTDKFELSAFDFSAVYPRDNKVVELPVDSISPSVVDRGHFHSGVACALRISSQTEGLDFNWVAFNKPKKLTVQFGGFLLGLGLLGFLKNLEEWQIYNLLGSKFAPVSIGMLLGMCASARGSMDLMLNKLICVHVDSFLPQGSNDMNISHEVQTAAVLGSGMLFERSFDKRITELLLNCLHGFVRSDATSKKVANEGYRVGAGIALGLVNLGSCRKKQEEKVGFSDNYGELISDATISKLLATVKLDNDYENELMIDNSFIGATVSLMLIYLKSNNYEVAKIFKKYSLQKSSSAKEAPTARPDFYFYTELAYNMIMWDFLDENMLLSFLKSFLKSDVSTMERKLMGLTVLPAYYQLAGFLISYALKNVSSNDAIFLRYVLPILDKLLSLPTKSFGSTYNSSVFLENMNQIKQLIMLSFALVFCGSGNLEVFSRLKFVHESTSSFSDVLLKEDIPKKFFKNSGIFYNGKTLHGKAQTEFYFDTMNTFYEGEQEKRERQQTYYMEQQQQHQHQQPPQGQQLGAGNDYSDSNLFVDEIKSTTSTQFSKFSCSSMAIGWLFLGCGQCSFNTTDLEPLAYLLISLLPFSSRAPFELQETRHFYALAVETRCLITKNCETNEVVNDVPIKITFHDKLKPQQVFQTPFLLPPISSIKQIKVISTDYFFLSIDFDDKTTLKHKKDENMVVFLKPRTVDENTTKTLNKENGTLVLDSTNTQTKANIEANGMKNVGLYLKNKRRQLFENSNTLIKNSHLKYAQDVLTRFSTFSESNDNSSFLKLEFMKDLQAEKNFAASQNKNLDLVALFEDTNYQMELWKSRHDL